DGDRAAKLELLIAPPVAVVLSTFGCPEPEAIDRFHDAGSEVWVTVTRPDEARRAVDAGADALVVQGAGGGGGAGSPRPDEPRRAVDAGADALVVQGAEAGGHRASFRDDPADD